MLSGLSEKLNQTFARLRGKGRITEADIDLALREVRLALLEADVNFRVVKKFVASIREDAVGTDVLESLTPDQQVIAIVRDKLTELLGGEAAKIQFSSSPPTVILLAGLQGTGKTTSAAKLAGMLKRQGKKPLLAACDIYRPGAILQLQTVGEQVGVPVFEKGKQSPPKTAKEAVAHAKSMGYDVVIVDTAGRLHVDEEMMSEVRAISDAIDPAEVLLSLDAMTGQDAVNAAKAFHEVLPLTGIVLTKLDGDARGGAILSVREITGVPVKFVGLGEKLDALEVFHPDRMAGRILGMGDVLSLIEKAQTQFNTEQAQQMESKLREGRFDLEDFLYQMQEIKKMGPLENLLGMVPGMDKLTKGGAPEVDEGQMKQIEAIILSMTPMERQHPEKINGSRKRRISKGSGTSVQQVNRLLGQFRQMQRMMKQMSQLSGGKLGKKSGKMRLPRGINPMRLMR